MSDSPLQRVLPNQWLATRSKDKTLPNQRLAIRKRVGLVAVAVLAAGILTVGISIFSANGDWGVVRQRLFGEVNLANGSHSARSVSELNRLSWDNGLGILDTLDNMNSIMDQLATPNINADQETVLEKKLTQYHNRLREQINDRNTLEKSAVLLHTKELYSPAYAESMHDSLARYTALRSRASSTGRLVEETQ